MESAALSMNMNMMGPPVMSAWLRGAGAQALLDIILKEEPSLQAVEGTEDTWQNHEMTLTRNENELVLSQGVEALAEPEIDADGDLNLVLDYGPMAEMMGAMGGADAATVEMMKQLKITMAISLDAIGMRERITMAAAEGDLGAAWTMASAVEAKRELLEGLAADTLWAATSSSDPAAIEEWLESEEGAELFTGNPGIAQVDMMLAGWGLPPYQDLIASIGEDHLIYARQSAPFPALTVAMGIDEAVGKQILTAIATQAGWMDLGDGSYQGLAGMVPIYGGMADGALVITTHPGGIAAHVERQPGFFENATVKEALAEIPEDRKLQVIGLSRTGDWYGGIADIVAPFAANSGVPGIAMMGQDLRGAAKYGFLWSSTAEDGSTTMESGGLLGGLMTHSMVAGGAVPALMFSRAMNRPQPMPLNPGPGLEEAQ